MVDSGITVNGIAAGKHETDWEGDSKIVYEEINIGNYNADTGANGAAFDVEARYGFSRLKTVNISPKGDTGIVYRYDYDNGTIRAYYADYDATADGALIAVPDTTTLNDDLRLEIRGVG